MLFQTIVSRIDAKSEIYEIHMQLDINSEIYPMEKFKVFWLLTEIIINMFFQEYTVIITKSITGEETEEKGNRNFFFYGKLENFTKKIGVFSAEDLKNSNLLDEYQYAMYGKVFKVEEKKNENEL